MELRFDLLQYCTEAVLGEGKQLLNENRILSVQKEQVSAAAFRLSGRCVSSFNFVDHPKLTVSADGGRLLSFHCDCPEARRTDAFCPHCAALALEAGVSDVPKTMVKAADSDTEPFSEVLTDAIDDESVQIADLSYAFANSNSGMYPGIKNPQIPLERYQLFFKGLYAETLFKMQGEWGGNCFGVTTTSAMFYQQGNGVALSDFARRVAFPGQLRREDENRSWELTLLGFIEAMQISQYHPAISEFTNKIWNTSLNEKLKVVCAAVQELQNNGNVMLVLNIWENRRGNGGHSIFPYRWERTGERSERLTIYDPNWPLKERFMDLETDANGNYINWRFPMFGNFTYSGDTGGMLAYMPFTNAQQTWDQRGSDVSLAMFTVQCSAVTLCDADDTPVVHVRDGEVEALREDVLPIRVVQGKSNNATSFWIKPGTYKLHSDTPESELLSFTYLTEEQSVDAAAEYREIIVQLDDSNEICAVIVPKEELKRCRAKKTMVDQKDQAESETVNFRTCLKSFGEEAVVDGLTRTSSSEPGTVAFWAKEKQMKCVLDSYALRSLTVNGVDTDAEALRTEAVPEELIRFFPEKQKQEEDKQKIRIVSESASNEESEETPKE